MKINKVPHHEFWPFWLLYGPIYWDYAWASVKMRTFKYPLVVNPMMELSGFIGEKKYNILQNLAPNVVPKTIYIDHQKSLSEQFQWQENTQWVAKPNQGERGMGVKKISSHMDIKVYHDKAPRPYILQEYVDFPVEFGVFFVRTPENPKGTISSLCSKDPVCVVGDGKSNVRELCQAHPRFQKQVERLTDILSPNQWLYVPAQNETYHVDVIRNHRRGSCFRDVRALITDKMIQTIQDIFPPESGFNYGRIDLRAKNVEDFRNGENFKILEVNGVTSEPGEIYDPQMKLSESLSILRKHWKYVEEIGKNQVKNQTRPPKTKEIFNMFKEAIERPAFFDR